MLIAFTSKDGKRSLRLLCRSDRGPLLTFDLTPSPRVGTGHVEPSYYENTTFSVELKDATRLTDNDRSVVSGICRNCRTWTSGSIDFNSTEAPRFFAAGPDQAQSQQQQQTCSPEKA